jgi:hypothetical protein
MGQQISEQRYLSQVTQCPDRRSQDTQWTALVSCDRMFMPYAEDDYRDVPLTLGAWNSAAGNATREDALRSTAPLHPDRNVSSVPVRQKQLQLWNKGSGEANTILHKEWACPYRWGSNCFKMSSCIAEGTCISSRVNETQETRTRGIREKIRPRNMCTEAQCQLKEEPAAAA